MSDRIPESVASYAARLRCHLAQATNITIVTTRKHPARSLFLGSLCLLAALAFIWLVPDRTAVVQAQQACGPQWKLMSSPNVPNSANVLDALSASSPSDIWAVGYSYPAGSNSIARTLAMHWDGAEWKMVSTPNPGPDNNYLDGIRTFAPNDAWAVGDAGNDKVLRNIVLHWDGNSWSPVVIAELANENAAFYAIDGVSSRDLWAVGVKGNGNGTRSLMYHYDGSTWSSFETSLEPGNFSILNNVVARAANDVWAVGTIYAGSRFVDVELHWDGTRWQNLSSADPRLASIAVGYDIAVPGPGNARFVVGTSGTGRSMQPGIVHVDGSTREATGGSFRVADYNALTGVVALSRTEAWAVGYGIPGGESAKTGQHRVPLVLHTSNGTDWAGEQTVPIQGNYSLLDIIVVPTTHDIVAVGTANGTTLIERYADPCAATQPTPTSPAAATPIPPTPTAVPTYPPTPIPGQDQNSITFPETGKTVKGIFLDYWNKNGGLPQQGYPISEMFTEISPLNKQTYTVQYFERAVFEYHPENQAPYNVLLSQLGTFQYKERYGAQGAPGQQPNTSEGSQLFAETGKHVGGKFLEYWKSHGGLAQQGLPISDEFIEKSPLDGKEYLVQYFERAVFELHPENQAPYDVLLSQLGTFQHKAKYPGNK